jgi:outer membrane protein TolC
LSLGITLYDFGQREFRLEVAELALVAAGHSYNSTLQGTIASALQGYYSLLTAQNAIEVVKEAENYAKASFDAAKLRHRIGQAPLADELQAKGAYSQALLGSEQAENGLALQQAALAILMGMESDTPVKVAEVDEHDLMKDPFVAEIKALMAAAKEKRYDLQASRASLRGAEESLKAQKRADLATLSVTTSMNLSNDTLHLVNRNVSRSQAIGFSVNIPIFTGFSQTYSERAAEKAIEAQRETLASTELSVEQDVWNSWHNYQTAKQSWHTSQDQLENATHLKDVALGRYKEGLGTILDVLNAQAQYNAALQSALQTRYSLLTSRVDLVRSVGDLNLETIHTDKAVDVTSRAETPEKW